MITNKVTQLRPLTKEELLEDTKGKKLIVSTPFEQENIEQAEYVTELKKQGKIKDEDTKESKELHKQSSVQRDNRDREQPISKR